MRLPIEVTGRHIRRGTPQDAYNCPLALALHEQYGGKWVVGGTYATRGLRRWKLDKDARRIPGKFDAHQHVKPQTVTMTGADLHLPRGGSVLDATGGLTSADTLGEFAVAATALLAILAWRLTVLLFRLTVLLVRGVAALVRYGLAVRADLLAEAAAERARQAAEPAATPVPVTVPEPVAVPDATPAVPAPQVSVPESAQPVADATPEPVSTPVPAGVIPAMSTYVTDPDLDPVEATR